MYPTKPLWEICDILDNQRKPISANEREKRIFWKNILYPYYWATQQNWWIDDYIFDEELVLLWEDWVDFFNKNKHKAYLITGKTWVNNHAHVLKWKENILLNKFLLNFLNIFDYHGIVSWATRLKLNQAQMKQIQIPLPPLSIQQKIVEKLDKIFAKIDKNISLTKQNIVNIDEENNAILEKIFTECEEGFGAEKLGKISKTTSWWTPLRNEKNFWWWDIPWLKSWELNDNLNIIKSEEFITEAWLINSSAKFFKKWTLLIAMYGATAGKLWILWFDATTNQAVCSIQNDKNLFFEKYLFYFLFSKRKQIIKDSFWWAQPNISKNYLDNLQIPLPPLPKQQEIVNYLDNIFAKNSELKNLYEKNLKNLEELRQSILKQAFEDENFIK